jgi:hypothetical protein
MGAVLGMDEMKSSALSAAIAFVVFVGAAPAYGQSTGFIYSNRCDVEIGETLQMRPRFRRDLLVWCTGKWLKSFVIPPRLLLHELQTLAAKRPVLHKYPTRYPT